MSMRFTKSDLKIICIALRILESSLPYQDEVEEILDKCQSVLELDELHEIDTRIDEIMTESDDLKDFAKRVLGQ